MYRGQEILVAIVDAGGRGGALAQAYSQCPIVDGIVAYPGHDLMRYSSSKPVYTNPEIGLKDVDKILADCQARRVTLVDVCQDNAVEVGVANATPERPGSPPLVIPKRRELLSPIKPGRGDLLENWDWMITSLSGKFLNPQRKGKNT